MLVTFHDAVTCGLVYLAIGSLVWFALHCSGILADVTRTRTAQGFPPGTLTLLIAHGMAILAWPIFAAAFFARVPR